MKTISLPGVDLRCVDRGDGRPLLLVHGYPLDHTMWAGQIEEFSGKVGDASALARIIAPDLRGFGRSRFSSVGQDKITMAQFADDLAAVLDLLGIDEPVVFCGLSMGGYIAFEFWRRHADRLRALILCDTRAAADSPEVATGRETTARRVLDEGVGSLVESMLSRVIGETTRQQRPELVGGVRRVMMASDPRAVAAAALGMAERRDMTDLLGEIRSPTLVMVGSEDVSSPPIEMRAMADRIAGSQFVEIPASGHLAPLEQPAAVNAAIAAFLATL